MACAKAKTCKVEFKVSVPAGVESLALDIINNCGVDSPW